MYATLSVIKIYFSELKWTYEAMYLIKDGLYDVFGDMTIRFFQLESVEYLYFGPRANYGEFHGDAMLTFTVLSKSIIYRIKSRRSS